MALRILTVCTGNICRSPQAEQWLRARLHPADGEQVLVGSAGTMAMVGGGMPEQAAALSRELGGDPSAHVPRQLDRALVDDSDLLLALARDHRSAIARVSPRATRRTFTLREFARIVEGMSAAGEHPATLTAWVERASARRGYFAGTAEDDDVIDPYMLDDQTYRRSAEQIDAAVGTIVHTLGAPPR